MTDADFGRAMVFFMDDNQDARRGTADSLRRMGVKNVKEFRRFKELRHELSSVTPHLIIIGSDREHSVDVSLLHEIREGKLGRNPFVPIMIGTVDSQEDDVVAIQQHGADDVFNKPFVPNDLRERIVRATESSRDFFVTSTYVGPERRRPPYQSSFEPPSALRDYNRVREEVVRMPTPKSLKKIIMGVSEREVMQEIAQARQLLLMKRRSAGVVDVHVEMDKIVDRLKVEGFSSGVRDHMHALRQDYVIARENLPENFGNTLGMIDALDRLTEMFCSDFEAHKVSEVLKMYAPLARAIPEALKIDEQEDINRRMVVATGLIEDDDGSASSEEADGEKVEVETG